MILTKASYSPPNFQLASSHNVYIIGRFSFILGAQKGLVQL